jgi:DNA-directed RNA polymerase specialized sigma24 family protein
MNTAERLAEYANLLNRHGVDSEEARQFLDDNNDDPEFVDLASLSRRLKRELGSPSDISADSSVAQGPLNQPESASQDDKCASFEDHTLRTPDTLGDLLRLASLGDNKAFSGLCIRVLPGLGRFVKRRCRDLGVASDLYLDFVHDTLIKAMNWLKVHPDANVGWAWLCKIANHVVLDSRRINQKSLSLTAYQLEHLVAREEDGDHSDFVTSALSALCLTDQIIINLVFFDGCDMSEAASRLHLGKWATYKRLQRAVQRLRLALQSQEPIAEKF